jgi:hypothetical protein
MPRRALSPLWIGTISFALAIVLALIARILSAQARRDGGNHRRTLPWFAIVAVDATEQLATVAAMRRSRSVPMQPAATTVANDAGVGQTHKWPPDQQRPRPRPESPHVDTQPSTDWRAFAACASSGASKSPANCVEVACRLHEAGKARKWIANVPAGKLRRT